MTTFLLANFGGPRSLKEVRSFLTALLTDSDVIRTKLPLSLHLPLFRYIAKKRSVKVQEDYTKIGNGSPIYYDTEKLAKGVEYALKIPTYTFHRYLTETHAPLCKKLEELSCQEIRIFPLFPQFSYATTGSIARFFQNHLSEKTAQKLRWIKSYETHPAYIAIMQKMIFEYMEAQGIGQQQLLLLFTAHGLPKKYIDEGDPYEQQCRASYQCIKEAFPHAASLLCYQSKFGFGKWLAPSTLDVSKEIEKWADERKHILFIPVSFTSDHIETLFEIETLYMPLVRKNGFTAHRLSAMNTRADWTLAIQRILQDSPTLENVCLIRS